MASLVEVFLQVGQFLLKMLDLSSECLVVDLGGSGGFAGPGSFGARHVGSFFARFGELLVACSKFLLKQADLVLEVVLLGLVQSNRCLLLDVS